MNFLMKIPKNSNFPVKVISGQEKMGNGTSIHVNNSKAVSQYIRKNKRIIIIGDLILNNGNEYNFN